MLSDYQKLLIGDLSDPDSYGQPLVAWKDQTEFLRNRGAPAKPGPLIPDLASTFVEEVYVLLRTQRAVVLYRGYESAGLQAPYGRDHPSYVRGLVAQRHPGTPDGRWWTPSRPSMEIDNLGLSDMHRSQHRDYSAVKLEWNRFDFYLEGELPVGSLVYVGRAAPQQESALYGGRKYGGGGMQFRLTEDPQDAFRSMRRHVAH